MNTTNEDPDSVPLAQDLSRDDVAPPDVDASDSADAVAPENLAGYLSMRGREYPSRSGLSVDRDGRLQVTRYHLERHLTRGEEALTPGVSTYVTSAAFSVKTGRQTTVYDRDAGKRVKVPEHKMAPGTFDTVPKFIQGVTNLSPTQKCILRRMYAEVDRGYFHKTGRFKCIGITLANFAQHLGYTHLSHISNLIGDMQRKGYVVRVQRGQRKSNVYYLASQPNGCWPFPAGSRTSTRAFIQGQLLKKDLQNIDWTAYKVRNFKLSKRRTEFEHSVRDALERGELPEHARRKYGNYPAPTAPEDREDAPGYLLQTFANLCPEHVQEQVHEEFFGSGVDPGGG